MRDEKKGTMKQASLKTAALKFVLSIGVMSFFADFTYEGSRSIIGPYLGLLGAGAAAIGKSESIVRLLAGLQGLLHVEVERDGNRLIVRAVAAEGTDAHSPHIPYLVPMIFQSWSDVVVSPLGFWQEYCVQGTSN